MGPRQQHPHVQDTRLHSDCPRDSSGCRNPDFDPPDIQDVLTKRLQYPDTGTTETSETLEGCIQENSGEYSEVSHVIDIDIIVEDAINIISTNSISEVNDNVQNDAVIYLRQRLQQTHATLVKQQPEKVRRLTTQYLRNKEPFSSALECTPIDDSLPSLLYEMIRCIFEEDCTNWTQVLIMLHMYTSITKRVVVEFSPLWQKYLDVIRNSLVNTLQSQCKGWIRRQGGWNELSVNEDCSMMPITDVLLKNIDTYFIIILASDSKDRAIATKLVHGLKTGHNICAIIIDGSTVDTIKPEVQRYNCHDNVIHVPFLNQKNVQNDRLVECYNEMLCKSRRRIIPVQLFGLTDRHVPAVLRSCRTLKAFPRTSYKDAEVRDFVGVLVKQCDSQLGKDVMDNLANKTDGLLKIRVHIKVETSPSGDKQRHIKRVKTELKAQITDPMLALRQHLQHMYKVKNIRLADDKDTDYITLEIVPTQASEIHQLLVDYENMKLVKMLVDHIRVPKLQEHYTFSVHMDETKAKKLATTLELDQNKSIHQIFKQSLMMDGVAGSHAAKASGIRNRNNSSSTDNNSKRAAALGKMFRSMLQDENSHFPYDLYSQLIRNMDKIEIQSVLDENGRNILHMIIASCRPEFFKIVFYLNIWDDLRLQMIDSEKDSQYGKYIPFGFAEKFHYKAKGPKTLEEFQHFDDLWMTMPLLHKACLKGNLRYVRYLVSKKHDIHETDNVGAVCILYACAGGFTDIVQFLIDSGSDPKIPNGRGENGLIMAAKFGKSSVVEQLLQRCDFQRDDEDCFRHRAIDYAAMNGDLDTMQAFSDNRMAPDEIVLSKSAKYQRYQMVDELITKYKLKLCGRDYDGKTALLNAAAKGNIKILTLLLRNGADLSDRDIQNRNCLHLVAEFNHPDACKYLLHILKERDVLEGMLDDRDSYCGRDQSTVVRGRDRGRKAWHYIRIKRMLTHMFKKKMGSGQIDVKIFGDVIESGFALSPPKAFLDKQDEALRMKLKECIPDLTPLALAVYKDNVKVAGILIEAGAKVAIGDHLGCNGLHFAAMRGNLELIQDIEKCEVDMDCKNNAMQTPLEVAERNDHLLVVNFLNGLKQMKYATGIQSFVKEAKSALGPEKLTELKKSGCNIRSHLIETLRGLQIDINQTLLNIGSGPIEEESSVRNTRPSSHEFAGTRPMFTKLPSG